MAMFDSGTFDTSGFGPDVRVMSQVGGQNPKPALGCGVWPTSAGGDDNFYANTILPAGLKVTDTAAEASLAQIHTDAGTTLHADLGQLHTDLGVIEATLISPAGGGHPNVVSVNNVITTLVTARPLRAALLLQNQDATNAVGISTAAGATFAQCPIILAAGQSMGVNPAGGSELAWFGITVAATLNVGIVEMY